MNFKNYVLVIVCLMSAYLNSGSDFTAVKLSKELKAALQNVQAYVGDRLVGSGATFKPTPAANMHITLKEIGDIGGYNGNDDSVRAGFVPDLNSVAAHIPPFKLHGAFNYSTLAIGKDGLVTLRLANSPKLTKLADAVKDALKNNKALKKAKKQGIFPGLMKRYDFPNNAHITLGKVKFSGKKYEDFQNVLDRIVTSFDAKRVNFPLFPVKRFELLWSNHPAKKRTYTTKKKFKMGS